MAAVMAVTAMGKGHVRLGGAGRSMWGLYAGIPTQLRCRQHLEATPT